MARNWTLGVGACGLLLLGAACQGDHKPQPADLVLLGGKIVTMDDALPEAQALAVRQERIEAIGSDAEIEPYIGESTRVIRLEGRLAVPGLIEGHGHFMRFGESLMQLDLKPAASWEEILEQVEGAVQQASPGEWIVGGGWHQDKWESTPEPNLEGLPLHEGLSRISPENPVLLGHTSGHGAFVNGRALQLAAITRETKNPPGGEIVRGPNGQATGMLREDAARLVEEVLERDRARRSPEEIDAQGREQARRASQEAIANGITSFQDMGSSFETIDFLKGMAAQGELPLRLYVAIQEPAERLEGRLADYRMIGYGGYLTVRTVGEKVLDGALGTHGGWLLEPYSDLPRTSGFNVTPLEDIRRSAELSIRNGFQMAIQGIGDRAVRALFEIYQQAFRRHPEKTGLRWRIEHAQVVHPDDLPRFAALGVIPSIQGLFACSDGPWVIDRLGEQRTRQRGYLFRSMIESGAVVTNGTDPPVEDIDPMASFHCSITRQLPDGSLFFPEQSMTRQQALRSYTLNNAYAAFEEDIKGSLTVGKLADITVLSKDILPVPEDEIRSTHAVYTIIGGEVKYAKRRKQEAGSRRQEEGEAESRRGRL